MGARVVDFVTSDFAHLFATKIGMARYPARTIAAPIRIFFMYEVKLSKPVLCSRSPFATMAETSP
jgi:hypothetical protein